MQTLDIGRVNDEDDGGSVSIVAAPVRADTCLTTEILYFVSLSCFVAGSSGGQQWWWRAYPNVEIKVLVCNGFDVETDGRYRGDNLANL